MKLVEVPEITSEFMEDDVEVVEELCQPQPAMPRPTPTKPGDITSTMNLVPIMSGMRSPSRLPILDLSEELVQLTNVHEEVMTKAREYIARMNSIGVFSESLDIGPLEL